MDKILAARHEDTFKKTVTVFLGRSQPQGFVSCLDGICGSNCNISRISCQGLVHLHTIGVAKGWREAVHLSPYQ